MFLERCVECPASKSLGKGITANRTALHVPIELPVRRERFVLWLHAPSLRRSASLARAADFKLHHYLNLTTVNKKRNYGYNSPMGSERASSVRQRYAGKICCECKAHLPPPHRRGERLCDRCGGAGKKRVYMHFMFRKGWFCQFLEEDLKTPLPRKVTVADEKKIFEMAKRGGFTLKIAVRQELQEAIRKGVGGIWLELTPEQYAKLQEPS